MLCVFITNSSVGRSPRVSFTLHFAMGTYAQYITYTYTYICTQFLYYICGTHVECTIGYTIFSFSKEKIIWKKTDVRRITIFLSRAIVNGSAIIIFWMAGYYNILSFRCKVIISLIIRPNKTQIIYYYYLLFVKWKSMRVQKGKA